MDIKITITPDNLAALFVGWDNIEQATFLNLIGKHFKAANFHAEYQCLAMTKSVDEDGKDFIYTLANFLKVKGIPCGSHKEKDLLNMYPCDGLH